MSQNDKDSAVLQAQTWAQEARTQRATVLEILRYFGLPERDWDALPLIKAKFEGTATQPDAGEAVQQPTWQDFYEVLRGSGYLTHSQARECASLVTDMLEAQCK